MNPKAAAVLRVAAWDQTWPVEVHRVEQFVDEVRMHVIYREDMAQCARLIREKPAVSLTVADGGLVLDDGEAFAYTFRHGEVPLLSLIWHLPKETP